MRTFVVPRYNQYSNVNGEFFVVVCPVWCLVHTTFQISNLQRTRSSCLWKTFLFSWNWNTLKSRTWKYKANSLHAAIMFCFGSRLVDWMFGSLVAAITFLFFCWLLPFHFTACFNRTFLLDLTAYFFRYNHYSTVFDFDCKSSHKFNGLFLLRALGCPKLVFHWSAAWLSWPPLWWGVISFQNLRTLKLGLFFA